MILIIGGSFQGKRSFAMKAFSLQEEQLTDGSQCSFSEAFEKPVLFHFHELIRRLLDEGIEPQEYLMPQLVNKKEQIIICNEIGLGIVPISVENRRLREEVGRILCKVAEMSDEVYRLYCGIPTALKGSAIHWN
jgi:adenosyl cobinamide kinase/adenosyl cobinamide phosphate guanylyltransferase